jgi:maleate isomerase
MRKDASDVVNCDGPYGALVRLGLITPMSDLSIERDWHRLLRDDDVSVFTTRVSLDPPLSAASLAAMAVEIPLVASKLGGEIPLDVLAFGCTSGAIAIGPDNLRDLISRVRPGMSVTDPATAAIKSLEFLDARRIAMVLPYTQDIAESVVSFFCSNGFSVADWCYLGADNDTKIASISSESFIQAAGRLDLKGADALFLSCTTAKTLSIIDELEDALSLPVLTSNQVLLWHALTLAGLRRRIDGAGVLLRSLDIC